MDVSNEKKKDINLDFLIQFCSVLFCVIFKVPIVQSNKGDHSESTKCEP